MSLVSPLCLPSVLPVSLVIGYIVSQQQSKSHRFLLLDAVARLLASLFPTISHLIFLVVPILVFLLNCFVVRTMFAFSTLVSLLLLLPLFHDLTVGCWSFSRLVH